LNWPPGARSSNLRSANDGGFCACVVDNPQIRVPIAPASSSVAMVGASMDLWTSQPGFNQDLGLFVCDSSVTSCASFSSFSLLAWKESGGFAGTFSPNAAYAEAVLGVSSAHNYV